MRIRMGKKMCARQTVLSVSENSDPLRPPHTTITMVWCVWCMVYIDCKEENVQ